jgi:hypothetical protein
VPKEIANPSILYQKGALFLALSAIAATLVLLQLPRISIFLLLVILVWSAARAYYFAFYVIERYVDPGFRYSGTHLPSVLPHPPQNRCGSACLTNLSERSGVACGRGRPRYRRIRDR